VCLPGGVKYFKKCTRIVGCWLLVVYPSFFSFFLFAGNMFACSFKQKAKNKHAKWLLLNRLIGIKGNEN